MVTPVRDPMIGRVIDGRYRVTARLASGGMATVYLATDQRLERRVAVKLMHAGFASDPLAVERFAREARAAARLSHPDVVAVFDQGVDGHDPFLVMEYVAGASLREVLRDRLRLQTGEAVGVMDHVLAALAIAHRDGMVHRDVKPENVMVTPDGRVKVADFGLAKVTGDASITTAGSTLLGTAGYLAPEQWTGDAVTARSDVYAAGVLLYELLVGSAPFAGEPAHVAMRRHLDEGIPVPSAAAPGVPAGLDRLVAWATSRDPADRPSDAGILHAALLDEARRTSLVLTVPPIPTSATERIATAAAVEGAGTTALPVPHATTPLARTDGARLPVPPANAAPRPSRRRRWPWVTLVLVLLTALAATAGWWFAAGRYVGAPNVVGKNRAAAVGALNADGLHAKFLPAVFSSRVPRGDVASESPAAGRHVLRHGTVELALSKGRREIDVPTVDGATVATARSRLTGVGFIVAHAEQHAYSPDVAAGRVVGTDPGAGTIRLSASKVELIVSRGPSPVQVPDVTNEPFQQADNALSGAGFVVSEREQYDASVANGTVISTDPDPTRMAPYGSTIVVKVSKGPKLERVPDVRGYPIRQAIRIIERAGFTANPQPIGGPGGGGTVVTQSPAGTTMAPEGSTVTLNYF